VGRVYLSKVNLNIKFRRIRIGIIPDVLFYGMVHGGVAREALAGFGINCALIQAEMRSLGDASTKFTTARPDADAGGIACPPWRLAANSAAPPAGTDRPISRTRD